MKVVSLLGSRCWIRWSWWMAKRFELCSFISPLHSMLAFEMHLNRMLKNSPRIRPQYETDNMNIKL
jgi:hypothetical protein